MKAEWKTFPPYSSLTLFKKTWQSWCNGSRHAHLWAFFFEYCLFTLKQKKRVESTLPNGRQTKWNQTKTLEHQNRAACREFKKKEKAAARSLGEASFLGSITASWTDLIFSGQRFCMHTRAVTCFLCRFRWVWWRRWWAACQPLLGWPTGGGSSVIDSCQTGDRGGQPRALSASPPPHTSILIKQGWGSCSSQSRQGSLQSDLLMYCHRQGGAQVGSGIIISCSRELLPPLHWIKPSHGWSPPPGNRKRWRTVGRVDSNEN